MSRTLHFGDTGTDVQNLQRLLNFHGSLLVPDGQYGVQTAHQVLRLQKAAGITQDAIIGPLTKLALFPSLLVESAYYLATLGAQMSALFAAAAAQSPMVAKTLVAPQVNATPTPSSPPDPPSQPAPPPVPRFNFQNLIVTAGNNFAWNPYAPSPLVVSATGTFVLRWGDIGWNGLKLSGAGQFSVNGLNSPNGKWTGQGAVQIQPISPWLDKNLKFFDERLDLTSVFITGFLQQNQNSSSAQSGVGIGFQPSLALIKGTGDDPILTLSLNASVIKAWDLGTGRGQPISPQFNPAIGLDIWQLLHQKK